MVLCDNAAIMQFSGSIFFLCFSLNEFYEEKKKRKKMLSIALMVLGEKVVIRQFSGVMFFSSVF